MASSSVRYGPQSKRPDELGVGADLARFTTATGLVGHEPGTLNLNPLVVLRRYFQGQPNSFKVIDSGSRCHLA